MTLSVWPPAKCVTYVYVSTCCNGVVFSAFTGNVSKPFFIICIISPSCLRVTVTVFGLHLFVKNNSKMQLRTSMPATEGTFGIWAPKTKKNIPRN